VPEATVSVRELRNRVSEVLRRVEAGERLTVTVNGRPVATLEPISPKRRFIPWDEAMEMIRRNPADPAMLDDIRSALTDTVDDVRYE
jgi:prevent-host-death family protein